MDEWAGIERGWLGAGANRMVRMDKLYVNGGDTAMRMRARLDAVQ
jgi:hypothetical protein